MNKIPIGILGASGMVGQQYLKLLANHPWFEIAFLASSEKWTGKTYGEATLGRRGDGEIQSRLMNMQNSSIYDLDRAAHACRFVFSALSREAAKEHEEAYAQRGLPVISNASFHRPACDIPVIIPEVNPEHLDIIPFQMKRRKWDRGFIVTKPNCSLQSYMLPLAPLHNVFGVKSLQITTLQAVSGAGHPGVASLDIIDNVIPFIQNEEEKSEFEPLKLWGKVGAEGITVASGIAISAHCNRVPVMDGHLACVSVGFGQKPHKEQILELWNNFVAPAGDLPSAPKRPIIYCDLQDRPQPRHDRNAGQGMSVTVGRLRECPVMDYRFVGVSHNTIRGAAGGGVLIAELLCRKGII